MSMHKKMMQFSLGSLILSADLLSKIVCVRSDLFGLSNPPHQQLNSIHHLLPNAIVALFYLASYSVLYSVHHYCKQYTCSFPRWWFNKVAPGEDAFLAQSDNLGIAKKNSAKQLKINRNVLMLQTILTEAILFSDSEVLTTCVPSLVSGIILGLYFFHFFYENIIHDESRCRRCKR